MKPRPCQVIADRLRGPLACLPVPSRSHGFGDRASGDPGPGDPSDVSYRSVPEAGMPLRVTSMPLTVSRVLGVHASTTVTGDPMTRRLPPLASLDNAAHAGTAVNSRALPTHSFRTALPTRFAERGFSYGIG